MTTDALRFLKLHETHQHLDGNTYSIDALIDRIIRRPRDVEQLSLESWKTTRLLDEKGAIDCVLLNPCLTPHRYLPTHLTPAAAFPVLVCRRGRREIIIDGVHRIVKALKAEQTSYPCIYVTYRELKKCRVRQTPLLNSLTARPSAA